MSSPLLMVVGSLNLVRVPVLEAQADTVLVVDPYRPLAFTVSTQSVEPVSRWYLQLLDALDLVKLRQLELGPTHRLLRYRPGPASHKELLGLLVLEAPYHGWILSCAV